MADRSYIDGSGGSFPANAKGFLFAPVAWFVWFVALYAVQGAGCALGLDHIDLLGTNVLRLALAALTVLTAVAIGAVGMSAFRAWRKLHGTDDAGGGPADQARFLSCGAVLHAALFVVAVAWTGIPILMTDLCVP